MAAETAPAKVNLYLHITGRRPDGYHTLDSLVVFAEIGDRLSAASAPDLGLRIDGPNAEGVPAGSDNLVLGAARALAGEAGNAPGAALTLTKMLPHAAGLGGGSADAGAALRLLKRFWQIPDGQVDLAAIAVRLGADVPACLGSLPVRMRGIGEVLTPAPLLPALGLCLVNPGLALPTKAVFAARHGNFSEPAGLPSGWADATLLARSLAGLRNDLEQPAIALCAQIATVLKALGEQPECLLARMSGSGATCFGLFPDAAAARRAAERVIRDGWWCWGGGLAS